MPWVPSLGRENLLEKGTSAHSSILAWRILWTEEPEGPQYRGSQRVRHNWVTNTHPKNKSQIVYHYLMGPGSFPASQPIMNHTDFSKNTVCCEVTLPFPLYCPLPGCPSPSQHSLHRSSLIYIYFSVSLKVTSTLKPSWPTAPTSPSAELTIPSLRHLHTLHGH